MRFRSLTIPAYGPFTNLTLDLPADGGDFHVVYGPNEAGKSSLLRALRALLFGIHAQTPDNFLHDYGQLRIAAALEWSGGGQVFQRRKGRKNTLLDEANQAVSEQVLKARLGQVDEAYFDAMFGLDADKLRGGADELLRGEGRLGDALFSASLGGTPVDLVIRDLEQEAGGIFAGRAHKGIRIPEAKREYDEHQERVREFLVRPEEWQAVQRDIDGLSRQLDDLLRDQEETANRRAWLERCRDALSTLGKLREHQHCLNNLPALPALPDTFAGELRAARSDFLDAARRVEEQEAQLDRWRRETEACTFDAAILDGASAIESLHSRLAADRRNRMLRAENAVESQHAEDAIRAACRDQGVEVEPDQLETLRITEPAFLAARERSKALAAAEQVLKAAQDQHQSLEDEVKRLAAKPRGGDQDRTRQLEEALAPVGGLEGTASGLPARKSGVAEQRIESENLRRLLAGAPDDAAAVRALCPPPAATIARFREAFDDVARTEKELDRARREVSAEIDRLASDLDLLRRRTDLPDSETLRSAREHRDRGWGLVLAAWKGTGDDETYVEDKPLEQAYPEAVARADELADRLRAEADSVAQADQLEAILGLSRKKHGDLEAELERCRTRRMDLDEEWRRAWDATGIPPLTPKEMEAWRIQWEEYCRTVDGWTAEEDRIRRDDAAIREAAGALASALGVQDTDLVRLVATARGILDELKQATGSDLEVAEQLRDRRKDLDGLTVRLEDLRQAGNEAAGTWETCRTGLRLPDDLSADGALELLRARRELVRHHDTWQILLRKGETLHDEVRAFDREARALADTLGLAGRTVDEIGQDAWEALQRARKVFTRRETLDDQIEAGSVTLAEARHAEDQAKADLNRRMAQAGLSTIEDIDGFLSAFEDRARHAAAVRTFRDTLADLARGDDVDAFIARIGREDAETLDGTITRLIQTQADLTQSIETVRAERQEAVRNQAAMTASRENAASYAQLAAFAAARMRKDAERFVRLRLAVAMLKDRIDQFREQNQGPLMERASHWFSMLTGGAFGGIAADYTEGDEPVITGVRHRDSAADARVSLDGMSEGTRDQLYLALRLAALEQHLRDHEPMPLILDDLLAHFDDARAGQALAALHSFGQRSQVLLFTHHAHLRDMAKQGLGSGLHLHDL